MPTAAHYRHAAAQFASLAERVQHQGALVAGWRLDGQIAPGAVASTVGEHLAWVTSDLQQASDELSRLARICAQRADVCDEYQRAVDRWLYTPLLERGLAPYPSPPYRWVSL